jgi:hypothetical protein
MKASKIVLESWPVENHTDIDIDWPRVHKSIGENAVKWLIDQPVHVCQLILEKSGSLYKLIAEFYNTDSLTEFKKNVINNRCV